MNRFLALLLALGLFACAGPAPNLPPVGADDGGRLPGKIVWRDLLTDTPEKTRRFYSELFGWEFRRALGANYQLIWHRGQAIGGLVDQNDLGTSADISQWVVAMAVADAERAVAAVRGANGTVFAPPTAVGERGHIAVVADPQGAVLALLQTPNGEPADSGQTPAVGDFLWDELWADDAAAAERFYTSLADFKVEMVDLDEQGAGFDYRVLSSVEVPRAGIRPNPVEGLAPTWVSYLRVADEAQLADILSRVESLEGEVLLPATERPGGGQMAIIAGPSGAGIALQTWSEDRGPVGAGEEQ